MKHKGLNAGRGSPKTTFEHRTRQGTASWRSGINLGLPQHALDQNLRHRRLKSHHPPIIKLRRPRAVVVGDVLCGLKRSFVFEIGDAGRAESVVADLGFDSSVRRAVLNHDISVLLPHFVLDEFTGLAGRRANKGPGGHGRCRRRRCIHQGMSPDCVGREILRSAERSMRE